jgi:hypothetical protein
VHVVTGLAQPGGDAARGEVRVEQQSQLPLGRA